MVCHGMVWYARYGDHPSIYSVVHGIVQYSMVRYGMV